MPGWLGMWFALFPNREGLISQAVMIVQVIGSYVVARGMTMRRNAQLYDVIDWCGLA